MRLQKADVVHAPTLHHTTGYHRDESSLFKNYRKLAVGQRHIVLGQAPPHLSEGEQTALFLVELGEDIK